MEDDWDTFCRRFDTDAACRAHLERSWWPQGPICPRCGTVGRAGRLNSRPGAYTCLACLRQFSVTTGTPLQRSHLPLVVWFRAMYLVAVYPQVSVRHLSQRLSLPYATAWALHQRIALLRADGRFPFEAILPSTSVADDGRSAVNMRMVPVPELSCGTAAGNHIIEGDNLLALAWLRERYRGQVQCILTDPPYGSGNRDLPYSDRFSRAEWLSWLKERLLIARDLLSADGALMVCIDDARRAALDLLLEEVMPGRRIGALVWRCRSGANDARLRHFSADHEHVLVYGNPGFKFGGVPRDQSYVDDGDPRGPWTSCQLSKAHTRHQRPNAYYPIQDPSTGFWYPCNPRSVWRFASEHRVDAAARKRLRKRTMESFIREGRVLFPQDDRHILFDSLEALVDGIDRGQMPTDKRGVPLLSRDLPDLAWWVGRPIGYGRPRFKRYLSDLATETRPLSSWIAPQWSKEELEGTGTTIMRSGSTAEGSCTVQRILGDKAFDYPKPLSLFQALITQATRPDAIVVDPFGGSGTTAHAVLAANARDHGHRQFILMSEAGPDPARNLCREVTAERVRRVIERGDGALKPLEGDSPAGFLYWVATRG